MIKLKTKFDGQRIEVPPELRGAAPREVTILYEDRSTTDQPPHSVWDFFGVAEHKRDAADIIRQIRADRNGWDAE